MKYWLLILYGVLGAVIILTIAYFLKWEPIYSFFSNISFPSLNIDLSGLDIGKLITENMGTIVGLGAAGVTTLITLVKYRGVQKTNTALEEQQQILAVEKQSLTDTVTGQAAQLTEKQKELEMYASDTTATQLQQRIDEMKGTFETQKTKLESKYLGQIDLLQKEVERLRNEKTIVVKQTEVK